MTAQNRSLKAACLSEVRVGKNSLQVYDYGRDLYDAMLAAIDTAQQSIYLETYIWKDDAIGQEKEHLAHKAAQGVEVYVVFDSFANTVIRPGEWTCSIARFTGTMKGPMTGPDGKQYPPTNKSFVVDFCTVARWQNGQIAEEHLFYDLVGLLKQIGLE